ncbi:hypothetical protein LXL04_031924 [Taraxacum kok-saghyz]
MKQNNDNSLYRINLTSFSTVTGPGRLPRPFVVYSSVRPGRPFSSSLTALFSVLVTYCSSRSVAAYLHRLCSPSSFFYLTFVFSYSLFSVWRSTTSVFFPAATSLFPFSFFSGISSLNLASAFVWQLHSSIVAFSLSHAQMRVCVEVSMNDFNIPPVFSGLSTPLTLTSLFRH